MIIAVVVGTVFVSGAASTLYDYGLITDIRACRQISLLATASLLILFSLLGRDTYS